MSVLEFKCLHTALKELITISENAVKMGTVYLRKQKTISERSRIQNIDYKLQEKKTP
jgi:hypothetical protein